MHAELVTRCNCRRRLEITYPPPPEIRLPLRASGPMGRDDVFEGIYSGPQETRRFLRVADSGKRPDDLAMYAES